MSSIPELVIFFQNISQDINAQIKDLQEKKVNCHHLVDECRTRRLTALISYYQRISVIFSAKKDSGDEINTDEDNMGKLSWSSDMDDDYIVCVSSSDDDSTSSISVDEIFKDRICYSGSNKHQYNFPKSIHNRSYYHDQNDNLDTIVEDSYNSNRLNSLFNKNKSQFYEPSDTTNLNYIQIQKATENHLQKIGDKYIFNNSKTTICPNVSNPRICMEQVENTDNLSGFLVLNSAIIDVIDKISADNYNSSKPENPISDDTIITTFNPQTVDKTVNNELDENMSIHNINIINPVENGNLNS